MAILKRNKIWFNIHLILTLICFIPLIIVAVTGGIISYHDEIIDFANTDKFLTHKGDKALTPSQLLTEFKKYEPNFTLSYFRIKTSENSTVKISGTNEKGDFKLYFVNPYTGKIVGENFGDKFIGVILNLHTNLGFGLSKNKTLRLIGKHIVAVSTIALIILVISGIVIYYPNFKNRISRAFKINPKAKGYTFLFQLHGSLGIWSLLVLLTMSITGLYWSYDWAAKLTNSLFGESEIFRKGNFTETRGFSLNDDAKVANLEKVFNIFKANRGENYELLNIIAQKDGENFMIFYFDKGMEDEEKVNRMMLNTKSGKILHHTRFDEPKTSMSRPLEIHKAVLSIHSGYIFGEIGKFIFCVVSLFVLLFTITGFQMLFKRAGKTIKKS